MSSSSYDAYVGTMLNDYEYSRPDVLVYGHHAILSRMGRPLPQTQRGPLERVLQNEWRSRQTTYAQLSRSRRARGIRERTSYSEQDRLKLEEALEFCAQVFQRYIATGLGASTAEAMRAVSVVAGELEFLAFLRCACAGERIPDDESERLLALGDSVRELGMEAARAVGIALPPRLFWEPS